MIPWRAILACVGIRCKIVAIADKSERTSRYSCTGACEVDMATDIASAAPSIIKSL